MFRCKEMVAVITLVPRLAKHDGHKCKTMFMRKPGLSVPVLQFDRHLMCTCKTGNGRPDDLLGELTQNEPRGGENKKRKRNQR